MNQQSEQGDVASFIAGLVLIGGNIAALVLFYLVIRYEPNCPDGTYADVQGGPDYSYMCVTRPPPGPYRATSTDTSWTTIWALLDAERAEALRKPVAPASK